MSKSSKFQHPLRNPSSVDRARSLRRTMIDAERLLWRKVRHRRFSGFKFRRQVPLVPFIADFVCFASKLIVELDGGQLLVDGGPVVWGRRGNSSAIGLVPADRQVSGCVLPLSVAENLVLDCTEDVMSCGLISRRLLRDRAKRLIEEFGISTPSIHTPVAALSGGNQQRVVLARELSKDPSVLVASQPTQGLDIEGIEDVWRRLREAATRGVAVLVISSDLDEIVALADRVAVISRGAIVGELARHELNHERLGLMMGGQSA